MSIEIDDVEADSAMSAQEAAQKQLLDKLRAKYGRICYVEVPEYGTVVFRKPGRREAAEFTNGVSNDKKSDEEVFRQFAVNCCVHPEGDAKLAVFDEYVMLPQRVTPAIQALGGLGEEFEVKKA